MTLLLLLRSPTGTVLPSTNWLTPDFASSLSFVPTLIGAYGMGPYGLGPYGGGSGTHTLTLTPASPGSLSITPD